MPFHIQLFLVGITKFTLWKHLSKVPQLKCWVGWLKQYKLSIILYYKLEFCPSWNLVILSENHSLGLNYSTWRFPYIPAQRRRWFHGFNIQVLNFSNGHIGPTGCCCAGWPHFTNLYSSLPLIPPPPSLENFSQFPLNSINICYQDRIMFKMYVCLIICVWYCEGFNWIFTQPTDFWHIWKGHFWGIAGWPSEFVK